MRQDAAPWRVLVVDDNENFRRLVIAILSSAGITEIAEAKNGDDAVTLMATFAPHVALVDWQMGPMNGADFISYVRTHPDSPNPCMPVIVVTGYTQDGLAHEVREVGADDFVVKPVSPRILLGRLMRAVQSPRPYVRGGAYLGPDRRRLHVDGVEDDRRGTTTKG